MWQIARTEHVVAEAVPSGRPFCAGFRLPLSWKLLSPSVVPQPLYVLIRPLALHVTSGTPSAHPFRVCSLRTPCVQPSPGPYGLLLVPFPLSYVLVELRIPPESQGGLVDNDGGVGHLRVMRTSKVSCDQRSRKWPAYGHERNRAQCGP